MTFSSIVRLVYLSSFLLSTLSFLINDNWIRWILFVKKQNKTIISFHSVHLFILGKFLDFILYCIDLRFSKYSSFYLLLSIQHLYFSSFYRISWSQMLSCHLLLMWYWEYKLENFYKFLCFLQYQFLRKIFSPGSQRGPLFFHIKTFPLLVLFFLHLYILTEMLRGGS